MSWRLLFIMLSVALAVSVWSGLQLGEWLVAYAPHAMRASAQISEAPPQPVLDADGRPYVAQPPQPRIDGTLGVPYAPVERAPVLVAAAVSDQAVQSVDALTREKTPQQDDKSQALPRSQASDTADVVTLDLQAADAAAQADGTPVQMQDYANRPRVAVSSAVSTVFSAEISGWQNALRRELARCATRGFFGRPACSWNARKRYCEPNRAWGTVSECPPKPD
jgi:hypothetical protein